ncbi:MAG: ABC transporter ATP-binding protein [Myxococcaceae bacterium]|nr:ABC transporter ATP-binding protein [Myxococcaceae bacterium]
MCSADGAFISVRNLSVDFQPVGVLDRVSFDVAQGELVCVVGPSGCGKSTLLNVLAGFQAPTAGSVRIGGAEVDGPDKSRIAVFQESAVFPWLTVEENVGFGLLGLSRGERRRRVAAGIERVGLGGFEHAYPPQLSGGMKQRAEVARALATQARVLFMDEPFGALDFLTRLKLRADLLDIWRAERQTIVFITHDVEEAVQLADRVLVLSRRPAAVVAEVRIDLGRPRDLDAPAYLRARDRILELLGVTRA